MPGIDIILFAVFGLVMINLASAGVAAWLAIRLRSASRARRSLWSCAFTGAVGALMFLGFALRDTESAWISAASLALVFGIGAVVAVPGAVVMSRLAERPPPIGDTFA